MNENTTKKKGGKVLLILVVAVALVIGYLAVTANSRKYNKASEALARGEYITAEELFAELGDYEDSQHLLLRSRYGIADRYMSTGAYDQAVTIFHNLGSYEDSALRVLECYYGMGTNAFQNGYYNEAIEYYTRAEGFSDSDTQILACYYGMAADAFQNKYFDEAIAYYTEAEGFSDSDMQILACYYAKGMDAFSYADYDYAAECFALAGNYSDSAQMVKESYYNHAERLMLMDSFMEARDAYLLAGDYQDAAEKADEAIYEQGHSLFLQGMYVNAQTYFDMLQTYPADGLRHFVELKDARAFLEEQASMLSPKIECVVGQMSHESQLELYYMIQQSIPYQRAGVSYSINSKKLTIYPRYYAGDRILYAWRTGDNSVLNDAEQKAMKVATKIAAKAKSKSKTIKGQELYITNWLCNNVVYESPDMAVPTEEYLRLRQLSCVGALLDGKANCQGYTDAFYVIANMAGLDVCKMFGNAEGEGHCWNGIELNDKLYITDVTFCDANDLGKSFKTYVWFNCAYDPNTYTIGGGLEGFPNLVTADDISQTYYKSNKCVFDSLSDAAYYLARQCKKNGKGVYHAMVEEKTVSVSKTTSALKKARNKAGVYNGFTFVIRTYGDDSVISIKWT